jgi:hypothetical protein
VQLEGLSKLKKISDLTANRTCDLPACSIVHQPSKLPHAPNVLKLDLKFGLDFGLMY